MRAAQRRAAGLVALGALAAAGMAVAAPGDLDPGFGGSKGSLEGRLNFSVDAGRDRANALLVQPDGKIVVAGLGESPKGPDDNLVLTRLTTSGGFDSSFGSGGSTVVTGAAGRAVARQADGKLIVAGRDKWTFAVFRFRTDGTLDPTFGSGGVRTVALGGNNGEANAVAIQADGKIVLAGFQYSGTVTQLALARVTASGATDTTFGGGDGSVSTHLGGTYSVGRGVAVQADGKIVVSGDQRVTTGTQTQAVARFTSAGVLDTGFNGTGYLLVNPGGLATNGGVALTSDGKLVLAGTVYGPGSSVQSVQLVRVGSGGSLDATFGTGGIAKSSVAGALSAVGFALALQPDGRIVVVGAALGSGAPLFFVSRFSASGALDPSFGTAGSVLTRFGIFTLGQYGFAVALQPDGKILAGGLADLSPDLLSMAAVARYTVTGSSTGGLIVTIPGFDAGKKTLVFQAGCAAPTPCSGTGTIVPDTSACRRNPQRAACNLGSLGFRVGAGKVVGASIKLNRRGRTFERFHPGGKVFLRVRSLGKNHRGRTQQLPATLAGRSVIAQSCRGPIMVGGQLVVRGSLYPAVAGASVHVTLLPPSGQSSAADVRVGAGGGFTLTRQLAEAGEWVVRVSWPGNARRLRAEAVPCFQLVAGPPEPPPPPPVTTTTQTTTTTVQKQSSSITLNCPSAWQQGASVPVNGTLTPGLANQSIKLVYEPPQGGSTSRDVNTTGGGAYSDSGYVPNQTGKLKVTATWDGNNDYVSASASCSVTVG
ncbi:MAG: hypothetical protein QOH73_1875 [Gaiellaceae bacterium]|nr:hypothetical protein [Gaiellaceae bacterium]